MVSPLACLCYKKKSSNKFSQKYSVYKKSRSNEQVERNKKRHSLTVLKDTLTFPKICSAGRPTTLRYKIICSLDIQPPLRTPELKGDRCICLKQNGLKQTAQSLTLEKDVSDDILEQAVADQGYKVTDIQ